MNTNETLNIREIEGSDLIRISSKFIVRLSDITNIELINEHPDTGKSDSTYPKYKISFVRNITAWGWCLISIEDFETYLKPFVLDITEL